MEAIELKRKNQIWYHVCKLSVIRPFSLDHFDDYEKHFTVMNYVEEGQKLKQVRVNYSYIPFTIFFSHRKILSSLILYCNSLIYFGTVGELWWIYPYVWVAVSCLQMGWGGGK